MKSWTNTQNKSRYILGKWSGQFIEFRFFWKKTIRIVQLWHCTLHLVVRRMHYSEEWQDSRHLSGCEGVHRKMSERYQWNQLAFGEISFPFSRRDKVILIWVLAILTQCYQSLFCLLMFPKLQVTGNTDHKVNHILLLIIIYLLFHQILFSSVPQLKKCGQYSSSRTVLYTLPFTIAFHKYWYSAARLIISYFTT